MIRAAGIDFSTKAIDIVFIDWDMRDLPVWWHIPLEGKTAWERTLTISEAMPGPAHSHWDNVRVVGIESPRGHGAGRLYKVQGAILARLPKRLIPQDVVEYTPQQWRTLAGLPGNAAKTDIIKHVTADPHGAELVHYAARRHVTAKQLSDACDAYCIARAVIAER